MSKKLGQLTFGKKERQVFLARDMMRERDYSEQTAILIDEEVRKVIDNAYERAQKIIRDNQDKLQKLADKLLETETLDGDEARKVVGLPDIKRHDLVHPSEEPDQAQGS
jgi:cell division protease FtsH